jgi:pimeloyl-ACP methyl ester carboxylesterase
MEKVISRDGTAIAYHRLGSGPPLIMVHGSGASNPTAWTGVTDVLQEHFTVFAMERRGYRESGDAPAYDLAHEVQDVAALVEKAGGKANLLGHSYGALVALEAARLIPDLEKLVLYEPGMPVPDVPLYPSGVVDRLEEMLDAGDPEGALTILYRDIAQIPDQQLQELKSSPMWAARVAAAGNAVREARVEDSYLFAAEQVRQIRVPTLLLLGEETTGSLKAATESLASTLPNRRVAVLPGQQHLAMYTAPEILTRELLKFLLEPA